MTRRSMIAMDGQMKRRPVVIKVWEVWISTTVDQQFDDFFTAPFGGNLQRKGLSTPIRMRSLRIRKRWRVLQQRRRRQHFRPRPAGALQRPFWQTDHPQGIVYRLRYFR